MDCVGRIDRIDINESAAAFSVIDYKRKRGSGARRLKTDIMAGRHFQLPIYLMAADDLYPGGAIPAGRGRPRLSGGRRRGRLPRDYLGGGICRTPRYRHGAGRRGDGRNRRRGVHAGERRVMPVLRAMGTSAAARARPLTPPGGERRPTATILPGRTTIPMSRKDEKQLFGLAEGVNTAVIAGAGTGKTTRLIGEIIALIERRGVPIERVLAVTFSESAAADMKEKLRDRLFTRLAETGDHRFLTAVSSLPRAQISTIHSLARRILAENPFEAGIDPEFTIQEESSDVLLTDEIWRLWAKQVFWGGTEFDDDLMMLLGHMSVEGLKTGCPDPGLPPRPPRRLRRAQDRSPAREGACRTTAPRPFGNAIGNRSFRRRRGPPVQETRPRQGDTRAPGSHADLRSDQTNSVQEIGRNAEEVARSRAI